jgi:hypothetical protein
MNSGYVGTTRSVRSYEAIQNNEMPLSQINKDAIETYLDYSDIDRVDVLRKQPVSLWKFVAKEVGASSWHHTGTYFNETNHYDLEEVAIEMLDNLMFYKNKYEYLKREKKEKAMADLKYSVLDAQIWGGSKKHPQLLGEEHMAGVQKNDWFYPVAYTDDYPLNQKYNVNARKVTLHRTFESYAELVKEYPEFKNNSKYFNRKIKILKGVKS